MIRLSTLKSFICFLMIVLLVLSFPIQVLVQSKWPALSPYILLVFVVLLPRGKYFVVSRTWHRFKKIELIIFVFVCLVVFHALLQLFLGVMSLQGVMTSIFIFVAPVIFYWYFSQHASDKEIKYSIYAILIASLISGLFFAYDSVMKVGFSEISQFSKDAIAYSAMRSGEDLSSMRAQLTYRSFGLLETRAISGAWIGIGCFAALALFPENWIKRRLLAVIFFSLLLIIGMNFTALVAFIITLLVFEFGFASLLSGRISSQLKSGLLYVCIIILSAIILLGISLDEKTLDYLKNSLVGQFELATTGRNELTYFKIILFNYFRYIESVVSFPSMLILGDGFTSYGMLKGGDVGFIETLARLGAPLFIVVMFGLIGIVNSTRNVARQTPSIRDEKYSFERRVLIFCGSFILFILVTELHYSIWGAKSIFPIFFIVLALFSRMRVVSAS